MKLGQYYNRELQAFRLMNGHQPYRIGRVVYLAFTFTSAGSFEVVKEANEISNHMGTRSLEAFRQGEHLFDIGQPLCAVERGGDDGPELGGVDRKAQEFGKSTMVPALDEFTQPLGGRPTARRISPGRVYSISSGCPERIR